jgi:DNA-binding NarL/FixJ family response regulator
VLPDPFERGRTMLVAGTIAQRAKQKRKAREALEQAAEIFDRLGARLWSEKAHTALERTGGQRSGELGLTPTEQRVAELVAKGRSNKEVAGALFVSVRTVEATLSKIYRKLEIESRAELTARLHSDRPESSEST